MEVIGVPRGSSVLTWPCNQLQTEFSCVGSVATCQQWLCSFFFSLFLPSHCWVGADQESSSLTVPCDQSAVVWLIAAGTASFPFLPFNHLLTTSVTSVLAAGFLPMKRPGLFETYRGFVFELITCLQEICLHKLDGWYACAAFGCKEGFAALFLSLQPDTPPTELSGDLGFVSEVNQTCACSKFADSFKK